MDESMLLRQSINLAYGSSQAGVIAILLARIEELD